MKLVKYWKTIIMAIIIFYGSMAPQSEFDKVPIFKIHNMDKIIHFSLYFILSLSFQMSLIRSGIIKRKEQIIITLVFVISYGLIMEVLQYYFTNDRCADIFDALANTLGCISGIIIFSIFSKYKIMRYL